MCEPTLIVSATGIFLVNPAIGIFEHGTSLSLSNYHNASAERPQLFASVHTFNGFWCEELAILTVILPECVTSTTVSSRSLRNSLALVAVVTARASTKHTAQTNLMAGMEASKEEVCAEL